MVSSSRSTSCGWSNDETKALVAIWGDADAQNQLDRVARNKPVYKKIATQLADAGFHRQCKTKIKNLTQKYQKVSNYYDSN